MTNDLQTEVYVIPEIVDYEDGKETERLRIAIGGQIQALEDLSRQIYHGSDFGIEQGLDIRNLPAYQDIICSLVELRDSVPSEYRKIRDK